jgi:SanA protein
MKPPRRTRRLLLPLFVGFLLLGVTLVTLCNQHILSANRDRLFDQVGAIPAKKIGLVLGTSQFLRGGSPNLHFANRIAAAAEIYRTGKVRHLLVSGDNRRSNYNEPRMMKRALMAHDVPASAITCDYAGFRTLDSVVRAKWVFDVTECIIVTQRYHNSRALEIARATGLDAVGYCAPEPQFVDTWKTELREVLARTVTVLDLYVWHREPHFLGAREPIAFSKL